MDVIATATTIMMLTALIVVFVLVMIVFASVQLWQIHQYIKRSDRQIKEMAFWLARGDEAIADAKLNLSLGNIDEFEKACERYVLTCRRFDAAKEIVERN